MQRTYDKLYETTLAGTTTVVTISNIPQTYTDLVLVASMRSTRTDAGSAKVYIRPNGSTSGNDYQGYSMGALLNGAYVDSLVRGILGGTYTVGIMLSATALASSYSGARVTFYNYASNMPKVIYGESGGSNNSNDGRIELGGSHWDQTNPITSLQIYSGSNDLAAGTTISLYGVRGFLGTQTQGLVSATGGEMMVSGSYKYHVFKSTNYINVAKGGLVEALLVAGGGGGGSTETGQDYAASSGGGAGGAFTTSFVIPTGPTLIAVGAGGSRGPSGSDARSGTDSYIGSFARAIGGGFGGTGYQPGGSGGSGGGHFRSDLFTGYGTAGQGNNSGTSTGAYAGTGGGGAGAVGGAQPATQSGGLGGNGINSVATNWLTPTNTGVSGYIAGGGGGGAAPYYGTPTRATGGLGGGGAGCMGADSATVAENGVANTGGGGGGSGSLNLKTGTRWGGNGGSGLVIIRYLI